MSYRRSLLSSATLFLGALSMASAAMAQQSAVSLHAPPAVPALTPAESRAALAPVLPPIRGTIAAPASTTSDNSTTGSVAVTTPTAQGAVPSPAPAMAAPEPTPSVEPPAPAAPQSPPPAASAPATTAPPETAMAPAAPPAAAEPASIGDIGVALRARLATELSAADTDMQGIAAFYEARNYAPIWVKDGALSETAVALKKTLENAAEEGLDPHAYEVPGIDMLQGASTPQSQAVDTEVAFSRALMTYIRHASVGRVDVKTVGREIQASPNMPDPMVALASLAIAADPAGILVGYNPIAPQYQALKRKLAELREERAQTAESEPPIVPQGPTLKVGMTDSRVAVLRTRLGLTMSDENETYDEAVADAVKSFQKSRRMRATGTLSPQTVAALNSPGKPRLNLESELIANMERWRWLPHDLGTSYIFVNVPQYWGQVVLDGEVVHEMRVIVGKPNSPTPLFSDVMQFVVLNPSWYVPQSIIQKEYLPKLADDPDYLTRQGFDVTYVGNTVQVRQPPGARNALGRIKFMFPNKFAVYLHDTSSRSLFSRTNRAMSHGCVRVDNPFKLAELVLGADNGWSEENVRDAIGGNERRVDLKRQLPVHLGYFTTFVDDGGSLRSVSDIYGVGRRTIQALGLPLT